MKKILYILLLVCTITSTTAIAEQEPTTQPVDGLKIYEKALQKALLNSKGELAPGDTAKEVYGFKRNTFNMYIETKIDTATISTSTGLKIYAVTDYKTNQKTKNRIESSGTSFTPIINNTEKDAVLIRSIDKYVKGRLAETYIATDVGEEKVYNVWKINLVSDIFKTILSSREVPQNLSKTIINKIISKKYLKLTQNDLKKGLLVSMGLKAQTQSTSTPSQSIVPEKNRLNSDYAKILFVKQYQGVVPYDDVEILANNKQLVTTTPLHTLVLGVNIDELTKYIIENNKVGKYTFGLLNNNSDRADITQFIQNLYKDLEIIVWIDSNTYEIKAFEVPPYEISYTNGSNKIAVIITLNSVDGVTKSTGYIEPVPSKFITPKEIRNMFLKY